MPGYATLTAAWNSTTLPAGVTGTPLTAQMSPQAKLAALQGWVLAGPMIDVPVGKVAGYLMRNGKEAGLASYATTPPTGASPVAVGAAKMLVQMCNNQSPVTSFEMSDPTTAGEVEAMLTALVADTNTGLTATDQTVIIGYATGPTLPWAQTPAAEGGGDLPGQLSAMDLTAAGLATSQDFPGA